MRFSVHLKRAVVTTMIVVFVGLSGRAIYKTYRWKRFAVVEKGRVYRSGQLYDWQLAEAIDRFKLKTVICLNSDFVEQERAICAKAPTVSFHSYHMPDDGVGRPEDFVEIVRMLTDPAHQPVLVHCSAGVARTGASIALFRMHKYGWSFDKALTELKTFERKGRCKPELQEHIQLVYRDHIAPKLTSTPIRMASGPRMSTK